MDPARTAVLGSAGYFIHLYAPLFYGAFYCMLIGLGNRLGHVVPEEEAKDILLSFHDPAGHIPLGPFTINSSSKLVNKQSNRNTFQEP